MESVKHFIICHRSFVMQQTSVVAMELKVAQKIKKKSNVLKSPKQRQLVLDVRFLSTCNFKVQDILDFSQ